MIEWYRNLLLWTFELSGYKLVLFELYTGISTVVPFILGVIGLLILNPYEDNIETMKWCKIFLIIMICAPLQFFIVLALIGKFICK